MDYYPIFLKLAQYQCLVIGGGEIATRKTLALIRAGATPHVVAPKITADLSRALMRRQISYTQKVFSEDDLEGIQLVIVATPHRELNLAVAMQAKQRGILVNVVDDADACGFIVPSIVDRSPVMIAISSGGTAPVLTRLIRQQLETFIPAAYADLSRLAGQWRTRVKQRIQSALDRRQFWEWFCNGPASRAVLTHRLDTAEQLIEARLSGYKPQAASGEVYVVGAGPGDPELITLKALRLMQQADVVLYDNLVSPEVLDLVRRDAERISVAKRKGLHLVQQENINQMLVRFAKAGKRVCRLKGGDPLVFGRGGEELETLAKEGIAFQIVPGISAANGCAAYAGIPLTHRDYADSVRFLTGHSKDGKDFLLPADISQQSRQTLVLYMSLSRLSSISQQLIQAGVKPDTPVAAIQAGTAQSQRVLITNLSDLPTRVIQAELRSPTLIIVGQVVNCARQLHWFGNRPVSGLETDFISADFEEPKWLATQG